MTGPGFQPGRLRLPPPLDDDPPTLRVVPDRLSWRTDWPMPWLLVGLCLPPVVAFIAGWAAAGAILYTWRRRHGA